MIPYASRTGTLRNLDALRAAGWRLLVSATGRLRTEGFRYMLDNGAWTHAERGAAFDDDLFLRAVERLGADADWIVVPDVVGDMPRTLRMAERWLPRLEAYRLLVPVQDGAVPDDVRAWLGPRVGIFIGGRYVSPAEKRSGVVDWKERSARTWGALARDVGCHVHMGRVNSDRRIQICKDAGVGSFDGTSATKFSVTLEPLDRAVHRGHFSW